MPQQSLLYAMCNVMRCGISRCGDASALVLPVVDGVLRRSDANGKITTDLTISEQFGQGANTATMRAVKFAPEQGQELIITLGSVNCIDPIFAGRVLRPTKSIPSAEAIDTDTIITSITGTDYTFDANKRVVNGTYSGPADEIAIAVLTRFAPQLSTAGIVSGLPSIDEISITDQTLTGALSQIAGRIGGYSLIRYQKRDGKPIACLYLTPSGTGPMEINATNPFFQNFKWLFDLAKTVTRLFVEGNGSTAVADVMAGESILPIADATYFNAFGGLVKSGTQRIAYTGLQTGGVGTVVGPGVSPSAALSLELAAGSGIESGVHDWASTFVTAAGESVASPLASLSVGTVSQPPTAPTASSPAYGPGPDPGAHTWAVTNVTAAGETPPSPLSNSVTVVADRPLADPGGTATAENDQHGTDGTGSLYAAGDSIYFVVVRRDAFGGETNGTTSDTVTAVILSGNPSWIGRVSYQLSGAVFEPGPYTWRTYVNINGSWAGYKPGVGSIIGTNDTLTAGSPVGSNTSVVQTRTTALSSIPLGGPLVTGRNVYRTDSAGSQLKFAFAIANNTATTATDTVTDSSLGANVPTTNTAAANQVAISGVPIGPAGTIGRNIYRTVSAGSQLKLQSSIANNTATTLTDSTADASLGANVPTSDTSGLTQPTGQVNAGSAAIIVAGTGPFSSGGGWAIIGNGAQVVRYSGITGSSLTGIPSTGSGAITATVTYGSTITAASALTGVAASGDGSVEYRIVSGDSVNLVAQVDDLAAQAALAALLTTDDYTDDGIREATIQDRRLSFMEATSRGQAFLQLRSTGTVTVTLDTRDKNTGVGKDLPVDLDGIVGTFKIQTDQITSFVAWGSRADDPLTLDTFPLHSITASNERYSLEDILRQIKGKAA